MIKKGMFGSQATTKPALELKCLGIPLQGRQRRSGPFGSLRRALLSLLAICSMSVGFYAAVVFWQSRVRALEICAFGGWQRGLGPEGSSAQTQTLKQVDGVKSECDEAVR